MKYIMLPLFLPNWLYNAILCEKIAFVLALENFDM